MTRIAFYLPQLAPNPVVKSTYRLALEIERRGLEVRILTDRKGGALETKFATAFPVRVLDAITPALAAPALASAVRTEGCDALLAVTTENILNAALAKRIGLLRAPLIGWEHTLLSAQQAAGGMRNKVRTGLARSLYGVCDKVLFTTQSAANDAAKVCAPHLLNVGVMHDPLPDDAAPPMSASEQEILTRLALPRIVALGPLTRESDYLTLFRAFQFFARAKEGSLLVIGAGDQRKVLEIAATGLGLGNRIVFAGEVENPANLLELGHLFVSAAVSDTTGSAIIQALALGVPVVAADCPTAPREILADGRYGRLTPAGDPRGLWRAMRDAVETTHYRPMLRARAAEFSTARAADVFLAAINAAPAAAARDQKAA